MLEAMDLSQLDTSARHAALADVVITPRFGPAEWRDFHRADLFLEAGRTAALEQLPEPEREVVRLRYGINGDDPTPLSETGRRLGLSQDAVRRLERKALTELAQSRELEALRPAA